MTEGFTNEQHVEQIQQEPELAVAGEATGPLSSFDVPDDVVRFLKFGIKPRLSLVNSTVGGHSDNPPYSIETDVVIHKDQTFGDEQLNDSQARSAEGVSERNLPPVNLIHPDVFEGDDGNGASGGVREDVLNTPVGRNQQQFTMALEENDTLYKLTRRLETRPRIASETSCATPPQKRTSGNQNPSDGSDSD
ncbi:hypothetical protein BsWGS_12422 [Bradybaena similaris]